MLLETDQGTLPRKVAPVSVLLLTHNEACQVERCLRSVAGWADDIHVVDSGSTDETVALARKYTSHIHFHTYVDHASQLDWSFRNVPFGHDWLALVDADHVVTPELAGQIQDAVELDDPRCSAYYARHRYHFGGRPVRGFKPWSLRLMRHAQVTIDASEMVDYRMVFPGKAGYLPGVIVEDNLKERDLDFWIDKHRKFSTRLAVEQLLRRSGRLRWSIQPALNGNHDQRMVWLKERWFDLPLFVRPMLYFLYRYVFKRGFLDGRSGLMYHFRHALWFRMLIDAKIYAFSRQIKRGERSLDELEREFSQSALGRVA